MAAAQAQAEVQALLSFLTREAKMPLAAALPRCKAMRSQGLTTIDAIAKAKLEDLKSTLNDEKVAKQVHNAAKRQSNPKKRSAPDNSVANSAKQVKTDIDQEEALILPETDLSLHEIAGRTVETNRAPLFLAFAVTVARYTLAPPQPLSSRLSIAQAVTSAGAQSKAKYIGLTSNTAEDDGWAEGQPKIKLMGRQVAVMRRQIAVPTHQHDNGLHMESIDSGVNSAQNTSHEAFWGIDLEALRKSNGPLVAGKLAGSAGPPIHRPEAARSYLLRSIDVVSIATPSKNVKLEDTDSPSKVKKLSNAAIANRKHEAVAMLLRAIDHVCSSWAETLTADELDRRASSWYVAVRPEVQDGKAGWGQRGQVSLRSILDLAKDPITE